jgi:hypothetical protein
VLFEDVNADGELDGGDLVVASTVTDADGNYVFPNLPAGDYLVQVTDDAGVLGGWWKSDGPADGADNNSQPTPYAVSVAAGETDTTGDFGYYVDTAALGNLVWIDDGNGFQEPWDSPLPGALVTLTITYPNGDVSSFTVVSGADGGYAFTGLLADESFNGTGTPGAGGETPSHVISVQTPSGYTPSPIEQGLYALLDSNDPAGTDATVLQGQTDVTLQADPADETANAGYDFGFTEQGPLSCVQICDMDTDGTVEMDDIRAIMSARGRRIDPAGAANSGDCVVDGVLSVNDVQACYRYLGQSYGP